MDERLDAEEIALRIASLVGKAAAICAEAEEIVLHTRVLLREFDRLREGLRGTSGGPVSA
jgi:hypothetical protein